MTEPRDPLRNPLSELSVVIPLARGEIAWKELITDLELLPHETEILFVSPELQLDAPRTLARLSIGRKVRWIQSNRPKRALQLNEGAKQARGKFLWFLHADARFEPEAINALEESLIAAPEALHYFDLEYLPDGPRWTALNALGGWVRSHWLRLPLGSQGLVLPRDVFDRLGGFPEELAQGEDQRLVWRARAAGIPLHWTGESLSISARSFRERGWARTTADHLSGTCRQAVSDLLESARTRSKKR